MTDTLLALVIAEGRGSFDATAPLEDRCRSAMKACYRHWMVSDEDTQFKGAVAAVYETASDEEKERIETELASLRDLNALLSGVPIDPERVTIPDNPIGLRKMWMEVTA